MATDVQVTGIASFPDVLKPVPRSEETPNDLVYKINVLLKKGDPQIAKLQQIIEQERKTGRETPCLKDGATDDYFSKDPLHHDYFIFAASVSDSRKPPVVGPLPGLVPIIDPSKVKAGMSCTVYASIHSYTKGKKGVRAGLEGVMFNSSEIELELVAPQKTAKQMFGGGSPSQTSQPTATPPEPVMTPEAGCSYQEYIDAGWNEQQIIDAGYMKPRSKHAWE